MGTKNMDHFYCRSLHAVCAIDTSLTGTSEALSNFVINLILSQKAAIVEHQVHYLYLALVDLDSFEMKIIISNVDEEISRLAMIPDQIRSIKRGIQEYVRYLTAQEPGGLPVSISSG
jgi:hypothetical protein